jgi:uncharacterized OB-fold protein
VGLVGRDSNPEGPPAAAEPAQGNTVGLVGRDSNPEGPPAAAEPAQGNTVGLVLAKPRPRPTTVSRPFWDALRAERVDIQRCDDCGHWVHYPRARCSRCLSPWLSWHTVSGDGAVYSFSVARQATAPVFEDEVPQIITVVELPEGVRLSTTLVDVDPGDVRVGLAVVPVFEHSDDGITLLRYRPSTPT